MLTFKQKTFISSLLFLIADLCIFIYTLIKAFRVLCLTKILFDQLPYFNPYNWPLSIIRRVANPYFRFWSKMLPFLRVGRSPYDISTYIAMEVLSSSLTLISYIKLYLLIQADLVSKIK